MSNVKYLRPVPKVTYCDVRALLDLNERLTEMILGAQEMIQRAQAQRRENANKILAHYGLQEDLEVMEQQVL